LLQAQRIALPRRFSFPMREMLQLQPRFLQMRGKRAMNLLSHRRFRAAFDLMLLRVEAGEIDGEIARFWTEVQEQSPPEQRKTFGAGGKRRRRSSGRKRRQESAS
jgi:poly(A) polymerase